MDKSDFLRLCDEQSVPLAGYNFELVEQAVPYPFVDHTRGLSSLRVASVWSVAKPDGTSKHTVVLSCHGTGNNSSFDLWCGDAFFEGQLERGQVLERSSVAIDSAPFEVDVEAAHTEMQRLAAGIVPKNTGCHFWKTRPKYCKHTKHVLRIISANCDGGHRT